MSASSTGVARCGACTSVPAACVSRRTPGKGVHAASSAVRRTANTQVSVEPNISRTSPPKRASAAAAISGAIGAVADTMPASGGSATPDSTNARRCTGVVTKTRGAGISASARATSSGKNGRSACTARVVTIGSSTDNSMPYMCCGGTVATTCGTASVCAHRLSSATRSWRVLVRNCPRSWDWVAGCRWCPR